MATKNEIQDILEKYSISFNIINDNDEELFALCNGLKHCENSERPDSILILNNICFGIEHFEASVYKNKKGDINREAEGRKAHRVKLQEDMIFELKPSLNNLVDSITNRFKSHSNSFSVYLNNINNKYPDKEYRLVIFIEDISSPSSIVDENEQYIHPLKIDKIVEAILEYKSDVFAVVYCVGNEISKQLTAIKLETLNEELRNGNLMEMSKCRLQMYKSTQTVGTVPEKDSSLVRGMFKDRIGIRDTISIKKYK